MDARKTIRLHEGPPVPKPPTFPTAARQVFHLVVSAAGWLLFFYWWGIVLRQVARQTVEMTFLFLAVSLVVVVGVTFVWSWHNKRLFDRKGPRTQVREVLEDYAHDAIGRSVRFVGARDLLQGEPEVRVTFDDGTKTYRSAKAAWTRPGPEAQSGEGA